VVMPAAPCFFFFFQTIQIFKQFKQLGYSGNGFILRDAASRTRVLRMSYCPQEEAFDPQDEVLPPHGEERALARVSNHKARNTLQWINGARETKWVPLANTGDLTSLAPARPRSRRFQ
jgi:hypothetical protein